MDDIFTVADLIEELGTLPQDAPVMITVVKYPNEFRLRPTPGGNASWDLGTDVECHPLERGEVTLQEGLVYLTVELADFDEARQALR